VDSVKGDILKVYYPPCECGDEFGAGCGEIHKSKLGEKIEGDINLHQIAWLCERVKDTERLYNLRVDKVMELEDEIEGLKNNITSLIQEIGKSYKTGKLVGFSKKGLC
tara:strand:+ start:561 stop:884 length:324 start_codon:yes stop_codon:yes gene_type:complete